MSDKKYDFSLDREFQELVDKHKPSIKDNIAIAKSAINRAVKIADETGIPFSFNGETYVPSLYKSKFEVDMDDFDENDILEQPEGVQSIEEILNELGAYYTQYEGWNSSSSSC